MEELPARAHELVGAGAHELRVGDEDHRVGGHRVGQQLELGHEGRDEGLHALARLALGDPLEHLGQLGVVAGQGRGAGADLGRDEQLAAGHGGELVEGPVHGALVGDGEEAHLLDGVAEEVDADRMVVGGVEDVDDAAAHRELAATLDQVDAIVGGRHELGLEAGRVVLGAGPQPHGRQPRQALDLGLEDGADGRDDHPRRRGAVGAGQAAQHREAPPDGVRARTEALVGQGLPGRVVGDSLLAEQPGQLVEQLLGLAEGGGDDEDGPVRPTGEPGDEQRPHRRRGGDVEGPRPGPGPGEEIGRPGIGEDSVEQTGEVHPSILGGRPEPTRCLSSWATSSSATQIGPTTSAMR